MICEHNEHIITTLSREMKPKLENKKLNVKDLKLNRNNYI